MPEVGRDRRARRSDVAPTGGRGLRLNPGAPSPACGTLPPERPNRPTTGRAYICAPPPPAPLPQTRD